MEIRDKIYYILVVLLKISVVLVIYHLYQIFIDRKYKKNYSTSDVNKVKISIIILVKDKFEWLQYLNHKLNIIEKQYNFLFNFEYFILENNSTDGTKKYLDHFYQNRSGKYLSIDINESELKKYSFDDPISKNRGKLMANLRNKLKSDYTAIIDSDVYFDFNIFLKMIDKLKNKEIGMVTPFVTDFANKLETDFTHYYDTFALITMDDIDFTKVGTACLFKQCDKCRQIRKIRNIDIDEKQLLDLNGNENNLIEVKSAFGCFAMLRTNIYNQVNWEETICEHLSFCRKIRNYGKIVIATDIKITNNSG